MRAIRGKSSLSEEKSNEKGDLFYNPIVQSEFEQFERRMRENRKKKWVQKTIDSAEKKSKTVNIEQELKLIKYYHNRLN